MREAGFTLCDRTIRRAALRGERWGLKDIPHEDPATYDMICKADTIGVFQIESRAQMSMLPRLRPRCFYDLVIEVAIIRPGPIQGGMIHPYLRRRQGLEPVTYPSRDLETALSRTLGVPIFQEQVMQLAMLAAGFSAGEADQLRRAMAAWKRKGGLEKYYDRIVNGMTSRGYEEAFAKAIFEQTRAGRAASGRGGDAPMPPEGGSQLPLRPHPGAAVPRTDPPQARPLRIAPGASDAARPRRALIERTAVLAGLRRALSPEPPSPLSIAAQVDGGAQGAAGGFGRHPAGDVPSQPHHRPLAR